MKRSEMRRFEPEDISPIHPTSIKYAQIHQLMKNSPWIERSGFRYKEIAVKALLTAVFLSGNKKWRCL